MFLESNFGREYLRGELNSSRHKIRPDLIKKNFHQFLMKNSIIYIKKFHNLETLTFRNGVDFFYMPSLAWDIVSCSNQHDYAFFKTVNTIFYKIKFLSIKKKIKFVHELEV